MLRGAGFIACTLFKEVRAGTTNTNSLYFPEVLLTQDSSVLLYEIVGTLGNTAK